MGCPWAIAVALWWLLRAGVARVGLVGVPFPCGVGQTFGGVGRFGGFEAWQTAALNAYKRSHCCGRGVLFSHCCGLVVAFACSVGRGKGSRKTGSTPPVVPGAAPALAKAGVGGFFVVRSMFCEHLACALATLSWLWACRIALVVARCNLDVARATISWLSACRIALAVVRCEFSCRWRNPLGTLFVSDRSRCRAVLILAYSLRSCGKEILWVLWKVLLWRCCSSLEGPSMTMLQEFHGAALEVDNIWSSWPRSSVRGPCMNFEQVLMRRSCEDPVDILEESLHDLAQVRARRSCGDPGEVLSKRS